MHYWSYGIIYNSPTTSWEKKQLVPHSIVLAGFLGISYKELQESLQPKVAPRKLKNQVSVVAQLRNRQPGTKLLNFLLIFMVDGHETHQKRGVLKTADFHQFHPFPQAKIVTWEGPSGLGSGWFREIAPKFTASRKPRNLNQLRKDLLGKWWWFLYQIQRNQKRNPRLWGKFKFFQHLFYRNVRKVVPIWVHQNSLWSALGVVWIELLGSSKLSKSLKKTGFHLSLFNPRIFFLKSSPPKNEETQK